MSGFGVDQGAGGTAVAVLRSTGEPGKASPIRGGGRTEKRTRRREPGKIVAVVAWCEANDVHFLFGLAKNDRLIVVIAGELAGRGEEPGIHGFERVVDQIEDHLSQLPPMASSAAIKSTTKVCRRPRKCGRIRTLMCKVKIHLWPIQQ
jgi:hypothetical protein